MMKHTPGPWENDEGDITGKGGSHIAAVATIDVFPCLDVKEMHPEQREDLENELKGNARLIAKSPEMLAMLKRALHLLRRWGHEGADTYPESPDTYRKGTEPLAALIKEIEG